jgi:protein tyrosine phosphatase
MTVICVCVVCVILHLKRHACVIISVQYNFLYDLPTHLQAWKRTSRRGWLIRVCFDIICVCVILRLKRHACVIISVQYNFLYDLPTHLQSL